MKYVKVPIQKAHMSVRDGTGAPTVASFNIILFTEIPNLTLNLANNTIQMATFPFFVFLVIFLLILPHITSNPVCDPYEVCGESYIEFPFSFRDRNPSKRCGYPGFDLSCDNNGPLLNIPSAGNFVVSSMYSDHVYIDDTDGCFPRRFLSRNVSLAGTPFKWGDDYALVNFTFLKCPDLVNLYPLDRVSCLSRSYNSNVVVLLPNKSYENEWISSCQLISSAWIPMSNSRLWDFFWDIYSGIELKWSEPDCRKCNTSYQRCGLLGDTGLNVTCYPRNTPPNNAANGDPSRGMTCGMALGITAVVAICFMLQCYLACGRSRREQPQQQSPQSSLELSTSNAPQPPFFAVNTVGLDRSIIETYPKIEVSESGALPDPNENVCAICLSEYKPKETLRIIPSCSHYFHLKCLDKWLKMNATCPLCRNFAGSFFVF